MKLVLTSGGISNKSILNKLKEFIGMDFHNLNLLFCITASAYDGGCMNSWLIDDLKMLDNLGFNIDVCDINGIPKDKLFSRLEWADVLYFEGGNTQWLMESIKRLELENILKEMLNDKIWIGASAGSCVLCPTISNACQDLYDEDVSEFTKDGLGFVDFQFMPHLDNEMCYNIAYDKIVESSKKLSLKDGKELYALDDNSALFVRDFEVEVVSEGKWFKLEVSSDEK